MNIKQSIFHYIAAHQPQRQVVYPDFNKVKSVLLLYESEWMERNSHIHSMVQQLRSGGKQVVTWGYIHKDKPLAPILPDSRVLGIKDCSLLDKPKSQVVQDLQRTRFDMLIDLTIAPLLPLQYVALFAQADFKIGAYATDLYDMVVQVPPSATVDYLFQQVMYYVKLIKSAD